MKEFIFLSNMAFIVITPMFLCIYFSLFLVNKYNFPSFMIIFGILIGITTGIVSCARFIMKKGGN